MKSFGPITLAHKELVLESLKTILDPFAEQTFSNLFLWRGIDHFQLYQDKNFLFASGYEKTRGSYLLPLTKEENIPYLIRLVQQLHLQEIYPIDEVLWERCAEANCSVHYNNYDSDYIYNRKAFDTLSGKALLKKKNLYRQFTQLYDWKLVPLSEETFLDGYRLLQKWYEDRPDSDDQQAMYDGLRFFRELNLQGWLLYTNKEPIGIYYGQAAQNSFVVHCAKAIPSYKGIYAFLHIECSRNLSSSIEKLNWEQDLGLEGLRQAKYTFNPSQIRKKGIVTTISKAE